MSAHDEIEVGGELDEKRLRTIMVRGLLLRNMMGDEATVLEEYAAPVPSPYGEPTWSDFPTLAQHSDGETPSFVEIAGRDGEHPDPSGDLIELHVGCGDNCGVFAQVPYDGDSGCVPRCNAEAIAHAGRDMIDLVREVVRLRTFLGLDLLKEFALVSDRAVVALTAAANLRSARARTAATLRESADAMRGNEWEHARAVADAWLDAADLVEGLVQSVSTVRKPKLPEPDPGPIDTDPRVCAIREALSQARYLVDHELVGYCQHGGMTAIILVEQRFIHGMGDLAGLVASDRTVENLLEGARKGLQMAREHLESVKAQVGIYNGAKQVIDILAPSIDGSTTP